MQLLQFKGWPLTFRWVRVVCIVFVVGLTTVANRASGQEPQPVLHEAVVRAFLEAEAQSWIKTWLNQHPPTEGIQGFGGKAMFVVQLLFAADAYAKADSDKARFHAATQGTAAYLAYAYAATPAVGLIATAVVLVAGIIESSLAGSYAEAMLAIQKDMIATQGRINDLAFRQGVARARRPAPVR